MGSHPSSHPWFIYIWLLEAIMTIQNENPHQPTRIRGLQKVLRNAEIYLLHSARGRRNEFWSLNKWKEARPLGINVRESNMARDTCPFLAGFPTKSSLYSGFSIAMFDNPRVHTFLYQM